MPAATEPDNSSAPKAAGKPAKPKAAKKSEGDGAVTQSPQKKPAATQPESAADKKKMTTGKKPATTPAGDKKQPTTAADKKHSNPTPDKKQTTPVTAKKQPTAEKKPATATADKKEPAEEAVVEPPVFVPKIPVALPVLNSLEWKSCAKLLENLLNFTPSLGAAMSHLRPFKSTQHLVDQMGAALEALPPHYIEAILKRFEELPLVPKSKLTKEHKCCVGLDKLTEAEVAELKVLYSQYREKFGFPFVMCAREAQASQLGVALRSRMLNEKDKELQAGRKEVKKIARLRLLEVVVA